MRVKCHLMTLNSLSRMEVHEHTLKSQGAVSAVQVLSGGPSCSCQDLTIHKPSPDLRTSTLKCNHIIFILKIYKQMV